LIYVVHRRETSNVLTVVILKSFKASVSTFNCISLVILASPEPPQNTLFQFCLLRPLTPNPHVPRL